MFKHIHLTKEEQNAQALTPEHLHEAVDVMDEDGVVVLRDAVSMESVQKLGDKMRADMESVYKIRQIGKESSNESLSPPLNHPWLFRDICYNEFAIQVSREVLGEGFCWNSYSSNTMHPRDTRKQDTHADVAPLFPSPL